MTDIERGKGFAIQEHTNANQTYDGLPYTVHLKNVAMQAERWIDKIYPDKCEYKEYRNCMLNNRDSVIAAAWCHDILEDTANSYNDLMNETNVLVADIVYAVTNEKGKTRAERANDKYYEGIRSQEFATFIKLCDRIANVMYSILTNSKQFEMYKKEHCGFIEKVIHETQRDRFYPMVRYLELLVRDR